MTRATAPGHLTEETVALLVEGGLEGERLREAEGHLAACEACVALVSEVGAALASEERAASGTKPSADADPEPPPLVRDSRVGRYVVIEAVGAGAMGRVYAAHDPSLDRKVALKLLHPRVADADLEARLLREAKAMARLTHPEVITVHDAGRHGNQLFIAMEFVDGGTLRQWLASRRRSWRDVVGVFLRAGRGLAQAHAAGIVHRDFKPDNVLVGHDGRVRVTDFGLARALQGDEASPVASVRETSSGEGSLDVTLTRTGAIVGTPAYMAPEQLAGTGADVRADVYAFCVALYEALYGERPYRATTILALQQEKLEARPRAPLHDRGVPPRLRRAILVGLRARPEQRYASMDDLLVAIERAIRVPRWPIAIGAGAVVLAGGAMAFASRNKPPPPAALVAAAPGCASDRACVESHGGAPWRCRASDHECVALASEDCTAMYEPSDLTADDTVWLGAMFPTKGPDADAFGTMNVEGADLARREIAMATSALRGSNASLQVRRIALVACDDGADAMRAAKHLVDVGVPAILGFATAKEIEDVAGSLLIGRGVVTVASLSTNPLITRLPQPPDLPRMVWRTTYSLDSLATATAVIVHDVIEPMAARTSRERSITLLRVDTRGGSWFGETLYRELVFNDMHAVDNGDRYQEAIVGPDPASADIERAVAKVVAQAPSIVAFFNEATTISALVSQIETRWLASRPRPVYLVAQESIASLAPVIGASAERRHRVFGVATPSGQTVNARFVMRFDAAYPGKATRIINPGVSYDAFYALAYATFSLKGAPVDGPSIARAFARLVPPGRPVETGPSGVFDGLAALAKGQSIDLEGPSGAIDFDLATGETGSDFALICASVDRNGRASTDLESGLQYRSREHRVDGAMRCP